MREVRLEGEKGQRQGKGKKPEEEVGREGSEAREGGG